MTPALAVLEIEITEGEAELILCFPVKLSLVAFEGDDLALEGGGRSGPSCSAGQRLRRSGSMMAKMLEKVWARGTPLGLLIHLRNQPV